MMIDRANARWSAAEELELLGCVTRADVKAYSAARGRPYTACLTKRCALLNGRRDKSGSERARNQRATLSPVHPQRTAAWRKRDEAFVAALKREAIRLGLVKVVDHARA
jgi:hypothetical protein